MCRCWHICCDLTFSFTKALVKPWVEKLFLTHTGKNKHLMPNIHPPAHPYTCKTCYLCHTNSSQLDCVCAKLHCMCVITDNTEEEQKPNTAAVLD